MDCCQCQGIEGLFDQHTADRNLKTYRRKGPDRGTRILLDALRTAGVSGATLLDIGGGIGVIQLELLSAGAASATDVDASTVYIAAARAESARRGFGDRVTYHHGNFIALAPIIAPADIVTLDRVICCYPDMRSLVTASATKARRLYGLVYPRDTWATRAIFAVGNLLLWLRRNTFRIYAHPTPAVEAVLRAAGLERTFHRNAGFWQVALYAHP